MSLHPLDSRKCAREGCPHAADLELATVLAGQRVFYYCSPTCQEQHQEDVKKRIKERDIQ